MTYKQLRYNVDCAVASGNKARAFESIKQDLYKTQISDCDHPQTIWITSADTGTKYPIQATCGECYHCRETKQNEWVTRMWHETKLNSRFCYFVTVTYKPQFKFADIPERLLDAFWHYDDYNETKHKCWSPCLLRIEHLQFFIRNLRNDLAASGRSRSFTYYACGEYGHEYGRPHFHMIVWSQDPITSYDITKAWSIRRGKKFMSQDPIGRIEIDDLNQNGTILKDKIIKIDGNSYSPSNAFKYVAKYVGKVESYNKRRIMYFIESMQSKFNIRFFNERCLKYYIPNFCEYVSKHCDEPYFAAKTFNKVKDLFLMSKYVDKKTCGDHAYYDLLFPFRPFRTCSRAAGIGSIYVKTNIDSLAKGVYRIADPDIEGLVFPSFYLRKTKDYLCGYEFKRRDSVSKSFSKGCRPLILSDLAKLIDDDPFDLAREDVRKRYICDRKIDFEDKTELSNVLNSYLAVRIAYTGERVLFVARSTGLSEYLYCMFFKYDRFLQCYLFIREMPFQQFYEEFEYRILDARDKNIEQQKKAFERLSDRLYCKSKIDEFARGFGSDYNILVDDIQEQMNHERVQMSKEKYNKFSRKDI